MKISANKLYAYKELAKKCESFDIFSWLIGLKEDWMYDIDINQIKSQLQDIYYSVHRNRQEHIAKYENRI